MSASALIGHFPMMITETVTVEPETPEENPLLGQVARDWAYIDVPFTPHADPIFALGKFWVIQDTSVFSSIDCIHWDETPLPFPDYPGSNSGCKAVKSLLAFNGSRLLALQGNWYSGDYDYGASGKGVYSDDGVNWTVCQAVSITPDSYLSTYEQPEWEGLWGGGGHFIAFLKTGTFVGGSLNTRITAYHSTDGINWTKCSAPSANPTGVLYGAYAYDPVKDRFYAGAAETGAGFCWLPGDGSGSDFANPDYRCERFVTDGHGNVIGVISSKAQCVILRSGGGVGLYATPFSGVYGACWLEGVGFVVTATDGGVYAFPINELSVTKYDRGWTLVGSCPRMPCRLTVGNGMIIGFPQELGASGGMIGRMLALSASL